MNNTMLGIPDTLSDSVKGIRWRGIPCPMGGKAYEAQVTDGLLIAVLSQDPCPEGLLWHLSVSYRDHAKKPDRCPTWDELKHAKYQLVQDDLCMVLIFPKRSAPYVNIHPTTLHLWESDQGEDT
jgi:hypothetical protein